MRRSGFTVVEILIATALIVFVAGGTYALLGSAAQFTGRRPHSYDAFNYAVQTLDTLKNYVTQNTGSTNYRLTGDSGGECPGVGPARYALEDGAAGPRPHRHPLPNGPGTLFTDYRGRRCYTVEDVDLAPTVDTNGDANPANDADVKRVTVTVSWREPR